MLQQNQSLIRWVLYIIHHFFKNKNKNIECGEILNMAKRAINDTYQKAIISKENGEYFITEVLKEEEKRYSLTKIIEDLLEIEDVTISIKSNVELEPVE